MNFFQIALAVGMLGCGCRTPVEQPNVLIVDIDSLRADRLRPGAASSITPHLAGLVEDGVWFDQAIAPAGWTLPSFASLISGRHSPPELTAENVSPESREADPKLLTHILGANGYTVGAGWGNTLLSRHPRAQNWFNPKNVANLDSIETLTAQLRAAPPPEPFVYLLHDIDLHIYTERTYRPEPNADPGFHGTRIERYDAALRGYDTKVGALLEALDERNLRERTLIVVTSDHGQELMDHGMIGHGLIHYDNVLRIPLLIVDPDGPKGRIVEDLVLTQDIAPTILARVGLPVEPTMEGISLLPAMQGRGVALPERVAFSITHDRAASIRTSTTKFVLQQYGCKQNASPHPPLQDVQCPHLYDLLADPGEQINRANERPEQAAALQTQLLAWLGTRTPAPLSTNPAFARALREGGYWQATSKPAAAAERTGEKPASPPPPTQP